MTHNAPFCHVCYATESLIDGLCPSCNELARSASADPDLKHRFDTTQPMLMRVIKQHAVIAHERNGLNYAQHCTVVAPWLSLLGHEVSLASQHGAHVRALPTAALSDCLIFERRHAQPKGTPQDAHWWVTYSFSSTLELMLRTLQHPHTGAMPSLIAYRHIGRFADELRALRVAGLIRALHFPTH